MKGEKTKTIILGAPKHFGIDKMVERELIYQGFDVVNISFFDNVFKYKNLGEWLRIKWGGKKHSKKNVLFKRSRQKINKHLDQLEDIADYALIIRPDAFPKDFIKALRAKAGILIAYQWDAMRRFPETYGYIDFFDRFFIFDPQDKGITKTLEASNFYPLSYAERANKKAESETDLYYWGNYSSDRKAILLSLIRFCKVHNMHYDIHLHRRKVTFFRKDNFITNKAISFEENLIRSFNSKVLIDLAPPEQYGLSFRVFEALGFQKKLITNNQTITKYDFYHPDNIFIYGKEETENLKYFLEKPYVPISEEIRQKYSFRNWIHYLTGKNPYVKINLPES